MVVRGGFERPEVRTHRDLAVRGVLLRIEGDKVVGDLGRVFHTCIHGCRYGCELGAEGCLVGANRSGAGHGVQSAEVHTIALADLGGRSGAVGGQNHLLVHGVRRFLVDLRQCPTQ